jgi:MarR family transcriptional regulator, lower aerobic nicotinate degradation pathway regulator
MTAETSAEVDALAQLSFAVLDVLSRAAAEHDLSVTQLRLLGILRDREPSMAAIAERLQLDRSSVTGLIDRAESRGLVARTSSQDDGRMTIIRLTPRGVEVAENLAETVGAQMERLLKVLSARQRGQLAGLAETIATIAP